MIYPLEKKTFEINQTFILFFENRLTYHQGEMASIPTPPLFSVEKPKYSLGRCFSHPWPRFFPESWKRRFHRLTANTWHKPVTQHEMCQELVGGFNVSTHLKNMTVVNLDHETPGFGVKIKHIWNKPPPREAPRKQTKMKIHVSKVVQNSPGFLL